MIRQLQNGGVQYTLVIDVTAIHEQSGGAGTYLRALVSALGQMGHAPLLIARRNDNSPWPGALEVLRVAPSPRPLRLAWEHTGLVRVIAKAVPDGTVVLHSPHYTTPAWMPHRVRRVVTVHDLTFFSRPADHARSKRALFRRAVMTSARTADAIVAVSKATAAQYGAVTGRTDGVFCAQHGVDRARFKPTELLDPDEARTDRELLAHAGISGRIIVSLGTIEPRKQIPLLLRAYEVVRMQAPDVGLVLAGQQWPSVELPAEQAGEQRLGFVSDRLAAALLRAAAVVAYPSAEEGFGMPLVEAMACGTAIVAARSDISVEVCAEVGTLVALDPTGTFVERLADALLDALRSGGTTVSAGLERSSQFSWDASARVHLAAYERAARSVS